MKADQARTVIDQAVQQLIDAIERGSSDALTRYIAAMSRFHRYSFGNLMLILAQRPDAAQVAGFRTWKTLGRYVRKGEKGIVIIAPMLLRKRDEQSEADAGREQDSPVLRFKAAYVFDITQTEGDPLPEPERVSGHPGRFADRLARFIEAKGIALEYSDLPSSTFGLSTGGKIVIAEGLQPADRFSVTVHELAHELLHRGDDRPVKKTVRETEAEAVAHIVCSAIGLDVGQASSDYIRLYSGDKDTLVASLDRIQRTACSILEAVLDRDTGDGDAPPARNTDHRPLHNSL